MVWYAVARARVYGRKNANEICYFLTFYLTRRNKSANIEPLGYLSKALWTIRKILFCNLN